MLDGVAVQKTTELRRERQMQIALFKLGRAWRN